MNAESIYMDHNATTPPREEVMELVKQTMQVNWANPSSSHRPGKAAREVIENARAQVAGLIGARPSEIVFTSGGTEANGLAIAGSLAADSLPGRIITTAIEHHAVLEPCRALKKRGTDVTELSVGKRGAPSLERLEEALAGEKALVSCMWVNNETGAVLPVQEFAEATRKAGGIFHSDAIQAVGKIPVDVNAFPVDLLSVSAHKLYAPKGVGALYIRSGVRLQPQQRGGHHERGIRGGTEATALIAGFGLASELAGSEMAVEAGRLSVLRDRLQEQLEKSGRDLLINGAAGERVPGTLNVSFAGQESERLVLKLSEKGVSVSSGSACTSGIMDVSHVLRAMNVPERYARGTLRFSLGRESTQAGIDGVAEILSGIL